MSTWRGSPIWSPTSPYAWPISITAWWWITPSLIRTRPVGSRSPATRVMRPSSGPVQDCGASATLRRESVPYVPGGHEVAMMVDRCAGIAAPSPRIHDPRHERVAVLRPRLLPGARTAAPGRDGPAATDAGGLPAPRAAAALDPLSDRPLRHASRASARAADARDRPDHRCAARASRSRGDELQVGIAILG